jgi:hypothetical protein
MTDEEWKTFHSMLDVALATWLTEEGMWSLKSLSMLEFAWWVSIKAGMVRGGTPMPRGN